MSCSRTQHCSLSEDQTHNPCDQVSDPLPTELWLFHYSEGEGVVVTNDWCISLIVCVWLDQLANLHSVILWYLVPLPWHISTFYSALCRAAYRYCKLAVILKFWFYLEIYTMSLVNEIMPSEKSFVTGLYRTCLHRSAGATEYQWRQPSSVWHDEALITIITQQFNTLVR